MIAKIYIFKIISKVHIDDTDIGTSIVTEINVESQLKILYYYIVIVIELLFRLQVSRPSPGNYTSDSCLFLVVRLKS